MDAAARTTPRGQGFTWLEAIVIVGIIALFAFVILDSSHQGHPPPSRRYLTLRSLQCIQSGLELYDTNFGEFPDPANPDESIEIEPGKVYRIGAAKCLYQALTGDGYDAIKGVVGDGKCDPQSDGKVNAEEAKVAAVIELPSDIWRKVGNSYFLVDAFGRPFQYTLANNEKKNPIKMPFDLWSYGEDEKNIRLMSTDAKSNPDIALEWIKNW